MDGSFISTPDGKELDFSIPTQFFHWCGYIMYHFNPNWFQDLIQTELFSKQNLGSSMQKQDHTIFQNAKFELHWF